MPQALYPQGKSPSYVLDRRLVGLQSWSGCSGEEINSHTLLELEPSIIQPIAQRCTTELPQLMKEMVQSITKLKKISGFCVTCYTFSFVIMALHV
jgi:hypothetical protein